MKYPILDPRILRHPVFRATLISGAFFRLSMGATPFLMPLMLQLGFGLTPFQSGMITFVSAIGALVSKVLAERIYAAFGFKRVLALSLIVGCALSTCYGFFYPDTPYTIIVGTLLLSGLARSIFFTGNSALAYEDISDAEASQATALLAVNQQISISLGVAVAGTTLEITSRLSGAALSVTDFHIGWWVVSALSLIGLVPVLGMRADAGATIARRRAAKNRPLPGSTSGG